MKKFIEALIGLVILAGLIIAVYYGYLYLTKLKVNGSDLNKDASACSVACSGDGKTIYVLEPGRLLKSVDGGKTWIFVNIKIEDK